jgi:hypothetical protein
VITMQALSALSALALLLAVSSTFALQGCSSSTFPDCNLQCTNRHTPPEPPTNACKEVGPRGERTCVRVCTSDADCPADYYYGCLDRANDGTMICRGCKMVNGQRNCNRLCTYDADCPTDQYQGCLDRAQDGSMVCRPWPADGGPDAG